MAESPEHHSALSVRDVDKSYGRRKVLNGVSFDIAVGERVALMGPSGSGKSTLLNLIAGIDHGDAGDIHIAGQALGSMNSDELCQLRRRRVSTVFQFFHLLPTLTVRENIEFPLQLLGLESTERQQRIDELIDEVQLGERADAFPDQLSGGEMQRVAIARALAPQPSLILADEPTGNLDSTTGSTILDLLEALSKKHDIALLLVTHHQQATRICSRTLDLLDGRLVTRKSSPP
jgi:ABC-type lipoprotein export system ATPase subunit